MSKNLSFFSFQIADFETYITRFLLRIHRNIQWFFLWYLSTSFEKNKFWSNRRDRRIKGTWSRWSSTKKVRATQNFIFFIFIFSQTNISESSKHFLPPTKLTYISNRTRFPPPKRCKFFWTAPLTMTADPEPWSTGSWNKQIQYTANAHTINLTEIQCTVLWI